MKRRGRPVLGAIAGLFFGLFLAADLAQWSVRPLDDLGVIGFPVIGALVGIGLGMWAPLGGRGSAASPSPEPVTPGREPLTTPDHVTPSEMSEADSTTESAPPEGDR